MCVCLVCGPRTETGRKQMGLFDEEFSLGYFPPKLAGEQMRRHYAATHKTPAHPHVVALLRRIQVVPAERKAWRQLMQALTKLPLPN